MDVCPVNSDACFEACLDDGLVTITLACTRVACKPGSHSNIIISSMVIWFEADNFPPEVYLAFVLVHPFVSCALCLLCLVHWDCASKSALCFPRSSEADILCCWIHIGHHMRWHHMSLLLPLPAQFPPKLSYLWMFSTFQLTHNAEQVA